MIAAARTLAQAALVLASTWSLATLVIPALWVLPTVCTMAITGVVLVILRRLIRAALVPTLVAAVVAALFLHGWYTVDLAAIPGVPDGQTIAYLRTHVESAVAHIQVVLPPIMDHQGVGLLVSSGATLAFLLAELVGVGSRAPVWSMVPVLALWTIPVVLDARVSTGVLVATGVAFLSVLATSAAPEGTRTAPTIPQIPEHVGAPGPVRTRSTAWWPGLVGTSAACVALTLIAGPSILHIPNPIRIHTPAELGVADSTRLQLGLDLRDDLVRSQEETVISYTGSTPEQLGPLHAYTLTDFDGSSWDRTSEAVTESVDVDDQILWPTDTAGGQARTITITVQDLRQDRLLLPGEPRSVRVPDGTEYLPRADELVVDRAQPGNPLEYQVTTYPRDLDPDRLRGLDPRAQESDPSWLAVPDTGYSDDIGAMAREIVGDANAETGYDEALALQNYLRDPDEFTYTESVTAVRTTDAVWDFLDDRRGYCVQFATTMVILARSLDLPARLAIGYLPGEATDDGGEIGSHSAHAWPQILFPEVGWVRFEPTPQQQTGTSPDWAPEEDSAEEPDQPDEPDEEPDETSEPDEDPEPTDTATETEDADVSERSTTGGPELAVVALVLLVSLAAALSLWLRRRERMGATGLEPAWAHVVQRLRRAGVRVRPDSTPRTLAAAGVELTSDAGGAALRSLAHAVEEYRYRAGAAEPERQEIARWVRDIEHGLRRGRGHPDD
ncbi:transglutaminase TgpA family protein [Ruania halotolerans]|uniref:transglutaminase TgpA family protein n=1 Tax=Ruania halotolerans TaxID=2897773 RepID=UPI001E5211F0|nr:DUF3488 and transglutaminase-like domain-containing protein [Ruania halotolerans]UFU05133.1 DUF3488 and transglutaminase-like domain-containing protein [Ruania halotolerans]